MSNEKSSTSATPESSNFPKHAERQTITRDRVPEQKKRYHFGVPQQRLQMDGLQLDKFHYHWINDYAGRVEQALAGGYEHVQKGEVTLLPGVTSRDSGLGSNISSIVGKHDNGTPLVAYLMKLRLDWYEENQAMIQAQVDKVDASISRGKLTGDAKDKFYVPKGSPIKMES